MQSSKHVLPLLVLASEALLKEECAVKPVVTPRFRVLPLDSCIAAVRV